MHPGLSHPGGRQALTGTTILTLDDDPTIRTIIRSVLTEWGCRNILQAGTGEQALRLFERQHIDLVLSDWLMEPMNGFAFVAELRKFDKAAKVPVIMVTANNDPADALAAQHLNIAAWIVKPITAKQLVERVSSVLSLPTQQFSIEDDLGVDLGELAQRYRAKLTNEIRELERMIAALPELDRLQIADQWPSMVRLFHTIKGQAGTFGFGLVTTIAGMGQNVLRQAGANIDVMVAYQGRLHRVLSAITTAMSLILRNEIKGDGGAVGSRLVSKLSEVVMPVQMLMEAETRNAKRS